MKSKNDFFFLTSERSKEGSDITIMNGFVESYCLSWHLVEAIYTDAACTILLKNSGFTALVRKLNPNVIANHCIRHNIVWK
jgi:hypothetical protein